MDDQLEISETNKEKNQIIVNKKYKFNLWYIMNNTKVFKYINQNDNNKVIKYENRHIHPGKEYNASVSILFITRVYAPEINSFYTTSLSILNNKEQATYELLFEELKKKMQIYLFYKAITNFPFINPECIFDINNHIKIIYQIYNYFHFLNFLEYFNKTYLYKYDIQYWNYYNDINHITNNASESFNNYLK
ncbi:hypothetical protein U3516DRAFT_793601 [Neocallimastix sp. 'constans']